jgi:hypothetical protein
LSSETKSGKKLNVHEAKSEDANKYFVRLHTKDFESLTKEKTDDYKQVADIPVRIRSNKAESVVLAKRPLHTSKPEVNANDVRMNWDLRMRLGVEIASSRPKSKSNSPDLSETEVRVIPLYGIVGKLRLAAYHVWYCPVPAHRWLPTGLTILFGAITTLLAFLTGFTSLRPLAIIGASITAFFVLMLYTSYVTVTSESAVT